jgi:hypothetical protein
MPPAEGQLLRASAAARAPAADGAARPRRSDAAPGAAHRYIPPSARAQPAALGREPLPSATRVRPASPRAQVRQSRAAGALLRLAGPRRRARRQPAPPPAADRPRPEAGSAIAPTRRLATTSRRAPTSTSARARAPSPARGDRSRDLALLMHGAPVNKAMLGLGGYDALLKRMNVPKAQRRATGLAPAIWALDQVSRPVYGVAGGADAAVRGKGVGGIARGVSRGARLKDQTLFSDVLKHAGVKNKTVRAVAGFGLDVALDPTTYLTFGVSSVGGHAVAAEARSPRARPGARRSATSPRRSPTARSPRRRPRRRPRRAKDIERSVTARRSQAAGRTEGQQGADRAGRRGQDRAPCRRARRAQAADDARAGHARHPVRPRRREVPRAQGAADAGRAQGRAADGI